MEESSWKKCEQNDVARYCEEYLSRYAGGAYARQAKQRLAELDVPSPGDKFRDCPGCPELVVVPSGSYRMGSPSSEVYREDDEGPVHRVAIARPFAVGVYEVTRGEFARFVSETGRSMGDSCIVYEDGGLQERSGLSWKSPGFNQTDAHPVVCVNWHDAQAYVRWLSRETGQHYRLLSEAEWEYVARAGTTTEYWWGGEGTDYCRYANASQGSTVASQGLCNEGYEETSPVGSFPANEFGLHDVSGNVKEWTEDCWNKNYEGAPSDGSAWESGDCRYRMVRGGSWVNPPVDLRSGHSSAEPSGGRDNTIGLRVARTLTP